MPNSREQFTQRARRVLSYAQTEAEQRQHQTIRTEHLLLGLLREEGGVASYVLHNLGLQQAQVEELIQQAAPAEPQIPDAPLALSPDIKKILELAVDEARHMRHHFIGTEHLLLGLIRLNNGLALDMLKRLNVAPPDVRQETLRVLQAGTAFGRSPTHQPATPAEHEQTDLDRPTRPYEDQGEYYWRISGKTQPAYPKRMLTIIAVVTFFIVVIAIPFVRAVDLTGALIVVSLLTTGAVMIGAEFYCILVATYRTTTLITSHHWDLLRLTPLPPERLFADLYTSIQSRCWQVTLAEVVLRLVSIEVFALTILQSNLTALVNNDLYTHFARGAMLLSGFMLGFLIVEARWRFEAVTAISIAISTKVDQFLFAALGSIATISAIHILQLLVLLFPFWFILLFGAESIAALCSVPFNLIVWPILILGFHTRLRTRALLFAQRELFRLE